MNQVVVTRLTSTLPAAISVLEVRGYGVAEVVGSCLRRPPPKEIGRIHFTTWKQGRRAQGETVVVCFVDDHTIELNLHGGKAVSEAAMLDLVDSGATIGATDSEGWIDSRLADASDVIDSDAVLGNRNIDSMPSTQRDVPNSRIIAERRLLLASTDRVAQVFLDQYNGAMVTLADQLHSLLCDARWEDAIAKLNACLNRASFGLRTDAAAKIVLAGPPNVGKSSLINALSGTESAIVHESPGTTRDWIEVETVLGGWPVKITDTAGIREASDAIEQVGVARARERLAEADIVMLVIDAQEGPTDVHRQIADAICERQISVEVWNKSDLLVEAATGIPPQALSASVRTGAGLQELQTWIIQQIEPPLLLEGEAVPVCMEQVECLQSLLKLCQIATTSNGHQPEWMALIERLKNA